MQHWAEMVKKSVSSQGLKSSNNLIESDKNYQNTLRR